MYVDDPDWTGPRCRFCGAPIKRDPEACEYEWERVFCSAECVREKYL